MLNALQPSAAHVRKATPSSILPGHLWKPRSIGPSTVAIPTGGSRTSGNDTFPEAGRCNAAKISYSQAKSEWETPSRVMLTTSCPLTTTTVTWTLIDTEAAVSLTTYCDGHPRTPPGFTYPVATGTTIETLSVCAQDRTNTQGPYPSASPTCTIAESDCERLWQTNVYQNTEVGLLTKTPVCSTRSDFFGACGECTIFANDVQLQYFPVSTTNGDLCSGGGSVMSDTPTGQGPNTQIISGQTYTSPSVYMSFGNIFATGATNQGLCGTAVTGFVASMWSFNLQSLSYFIDQAQPSSVQTFTSMLDLADLNYPVPWSAYRGIDFCTNTTACETITQPYLPQLVLPSWLSALQPAWATCVVHSTGVLDPPLALTAAATMMGPSMAPHTSAVFSAIATAAPASSLMSPLASQTSVHLSLSVARSIRATGAAQSDVPSQALLPAASELRSSHVAEPDRGPASGPESPSKATTSAANSAEIPKGPSVTVPDDTPSKSSLETSSMSGPSLVTPTQGSLVTDGPAPADLAQSANDGAQDFAILVSMIAAAASLEEAGRMEPSQQYIMPNRTASTPRSTVSSSATAPFFADDAHIPSSRTASSATASIETTKPSSRIPYESSLNTSLQLTSVLSAWSGTTTLGVSLTASKSASEGMAQATDSGASGSQSWPRWLAATSCVMVIMILL